MLKVIWIGLVLLGKRVSSNAFVNTYYDPFIMSIMSYLMHPWYLSFASACNRCTGRSNPAGIRGTERAAAADTGSSGGAAFRRSARRGHRWVPWPPSLQLCERQAPEHIKPPIFRTVVTVLFITYIVALSLGVGCKHLLHWLSNPCLDIVTRNPM